MYSLIVTSLVSFLVYSADCKKAGKKFHYGPACTMQELSSSCHFEERSDEKSLRIMFARLILRDFSLLSSLEMTFEQSTA